MQDYREVLGDHWWRLTGLSERDVPRGMQLIKKGESVVLRHSRTGKSVEFGAACAGCHDTAREMNINEMNRTSTKLRLLIQ